MNIMRKLTGFIILIIFAQPIFAQYKAGIFIAQNYSTFRFINSAKQKDNPGYAIKYGFGFSVQKDYNEDIFMQGILSYNNIGASSGIDLTRLDWSFHYVNLEFDAGHKFATGRFHPFAGGGLYIGRTIKADQVIGSSYYNLLEGKTIKKNDFGPVAFLGMEYRYSNRFMENGIIYARVNGSFGLLNLEDYDITRQRMYNRIFSLQTGILFSFR